MLSAERRRPSGIGSQGRATVVKILVQESDSYARRSEADWTSWRAKSPMNRSQKSNRCLDHSDHVLGLEDVVETGTGFRAPAHGCGFGCEITGCHLVRSASPAGYRTCPQTGDGGIKLTQLGA